MPRVRALIPDAGTYYGLRPDHASIRGRHIPTVDVRGSFGDALADALALDHGCTNDPACDIAAALDAGCPRIAAHLLIGATECETVDAVIAFYVDHRGETWPRSVYDDPEWGAWEDYHRAHGVPCDACGAFTYGDDYWSPDDCGNCGADLWSDVVDAATRAYVKCATWVGLDWSDVVDGGEDNPRPLDERYDVDDIDADALAEIRADVEAFARNNWPRAAWAGWTPEQFGHDYYLTRNGHGTGYWDRTPADLKRRGGRPPRDRDAVERVGRELADAARAEGEAELYPGDDGRLYHR